MVGVGKYVGKSPPPLLVVALPLFSLTLLLVFPLPSFGVGMYVAYVGK